VVSSVVVENQTTPCALTAYTTTTRPPRQSQWENQHTLLAKLLENLPKGMRLSQMTHANSSAKMVKLSRSSKTKKNQTKLKIVPIFPPYRQEDILKQLKTLTELATAGKIETLVVYYELKDGVYHLHVSPSEDTTKTGTHLLQMALVRLGML
jgi:hypothetical protein